MDSIQTLTKILQVRENEKKEAQIAHKQSVDLFEEVAQKLYVLLRKKEVADKNFSLVTEKKTSIEVIKEQSKHIENLSKQIIHLQSKVNNARNNMELKRSQLTEAHVEVKKFEKIIENRHDQHIERIEKTENDLMDEVSIQQYLLTNR